MTVRRAPDTNRILLELLQATVALGRIPGVAELATRTGMTREELSRCLEGLSAAHEVVLEPDGEVRMVMPFSRRPTQHVVSVREGSREQSWFANCAWDALGIPAALAGVRDGLGLTNKTAWPLVAKIETSCPITGERFEVHRGDALWVHFAVPAVAWWQDIGFT